MKAVQFDRFGPPEVLQVVDIPTPVPAPGQVLVRIHAAGVNFFEVLMRANRYAVTPSLPMIPGVEVAGVVETLGEGVAPSLAGARVAVPLFAVGIGAGGYAEYLAVDAGSVVRLPDGISFEDATALMVQGLTALHLVRRSPPGGKNVLVHAAGGGVGSLALQLARRAGAASVIATAGTREKLDLARSLGADMGVDYSRADWAGRVVEATGKGADLIYDTVGGATSATSLEALAPGGELVFAAMGRFALEKAALEGMLTRNQSLKGFALLPLLSPEGLRADLGELFNLTAGGALKIVRGGRYPLDRAADAHRALENRQTTGKVVLVP